MYVVVDGQSGAPWMPLEDEGANLEDELRGAQARSTRTRARHRDRSERRDPRGAVLRGGPTVGAGPHRGRGHSRPSTRAAGGRPLLIVTTPPDAAISNFGLKQSLRRRVTPPRRPAPLVGAREPGIVVADFARVVCRRHLLGGRERMTGSRTTTSSTRTCGHRHALRTCCSMRRAMPGPGEGAG